MNASRKATSRLRKRAHQRVDAVADSIDSMQSRAADYVDSGRERATDYVHTVENTIHDRPLAAILAGVAVGFVFGCFMTRR